MKASINNRQNIKCGLSQNKSINCSVQNETIMQGGMNEAENISAGTTQRGLQGIPGEAATIQLGTVATGEPGTDVIITNSGTENAAIFNFTIPEGQTGATGYSPSASVSKVGNTATITITDKDGTTTAEIYDGAAGVTDVEVNGVSVVTGGVAEVTVPTKTSQLNNDSNFATVSQIPTDNTELTNGAGYITGINSSDVTTALGYTPYDSSNPNGYITSSSLPTVNDATLTIQKNGTTVNTFTANSSTNTTVNITVPTDTSDLTNGADFVNSTDLQSALNTKQDLLTSANAGTDISITEGYIIESTTESGTGSVTLVSAKANGLSSVKLSGVLTRSATPTPASPASFTCNNGVIGVSGGSIITTGTAETVEDELGNTATAERLLSFDSDHTDEQEILTGAVTRKVGIKVLDGTETTSWTVQSNRAYALKSTLGMSNCLQPTGTGINSLLNSHFSNNTINSYGNVLFNYTMSSIGVSDVTSWNNWLATQYANGTPVIVIYPLNASATESVTAQTLTTQLGTNVLDITQSSIADLPIEATYDKIVGTTSAIISFANNSGYVLSSDLATVATTGDYDDLINKPYIPSGVVVDQVFDGTSTNAQSGVAIAGELNNRFTDNATKTWVSNNYGNLEAVNNGILWESTSSPTLYQWTTAIYTLSNTPSVGDIVYKVSLGTNTAYPYSTVTAYYPSSSPLPSITIDADNNTHYEDGTTSGVSVEQKLVTSKQGVNADLILPYADKQATQTALSGKADTTLSNVSSIDAGSAVQTALDGKANSTDLDGQWTKCSPAISIASSVAFSTTATSKSYDLTNYLPNDNNVYEVMISLGAQSAAATGANYGFVITSSLTTDVYICRAIARSNASVYSYGNAIIPIGTDRALKVWQVNNTSAGAPTMTGLIMSAYRKVR